MNAVGYKFRIDDIQVFMSHLAVESRDIAEKIVASEEWQADLKAKRKGPGSLTAVVTINGVDIPGAAFERVMKHMFKSFEDQNAELIGLLDKSEAVENAARFMIEQRAKKLMDLMADLSNDIENVHHYVLRD